MNFDTIQQIWNNQSDATPSKQDRLTSQTYNNQEIMNTITQIEKIENKQAKLIKSIYFTALATTVYLAIIAFFIPNISPVTIVGYIMISGVMFFTAWQYQLNKINIQHQNLDTPTASFLQHALDKFELRGKLAKHMGWMYGINLSTGIFLGTYQFISAASAEVQYVIYGATFTWALGVTVFGTIRAQNKFKKEIQPIIEELKNKLNALETGN